MLVVGVAAALLELVAGAAVEILPVFKATVDLETDFVGRAPFDPAQKLFKGRVVAQARAGIISDIIIAEANAGGSGEARPELIVQPVGGGPFVRIL